MRFGRMQIGLLFTAIYGGGVVALVVLRWQLVKEMPLNELGDFAAGAAGPIAFLWLVLGYFQQGDELALNTRALEAQVQELREAVHAQEELAKATREQTDLSKRHEADRLARSTARAQPVFDLEIREVYGFLGHPVTVVIRLTNVGAECAKLSTSAHDGQVACRDYADKLARHDFFDFKAQFPGREEIEVNVDFVYVDSEGEDRSQHCSIELIWNKSESRFDYIASSPKWFPDSEA